MSEIRSIHSELIKRCKVKKLTPEEVDRLNLLDRYPEIRQEFIPVLCTNISHRNLPSYFCYIHRDDLIEFIMNIYLPIDYGVKILSLNDVYDFFNVYNKSWILENTEITKYFKVKILDEFIYEFKCLNNEILRKYLTDSEIISLNYGLNTVKIENDGATIKRLGE